LKFSHAAARRLFRRPWKRNHRELLRPREARRHIAPDRVIELVEKGVMESVAPAGGEKAGKAEKPEARERREKLQALLEQHGGNVTAVAREMGKAREQVYRWIKAAALDPEKFRKS
jgi:DNA-binding NtrC family response regulator